MSELEQSIITELVSEVLKDICIISDKNNYNRDSVLDCLVYNMIMFSEIGSIETYEWSDKIEN